MALQGSLDTFSVTDVLALLAQTGKTGALHVHGDRGRGVLFFTAGRVCGAEAGDVTGPRPGSSLDEHLTDVCFELLRNAGGTFEFEPDAAPVWPAEGDAEVAALVEEASTRLVEWRDIEAVVPSLEVRPRLVEDLPSDTVTFDRTRWRVLTAIDGRRRVGVICRVLEASEFHVCRTLKLLIDEGVVELEAEGRAHGDATSEPAPPPLLASPAEVAAATLGGAPVPPASDDLASSAHHAAPER